MKRLLLLALALVMLVVICTKALGMPRPSWDLDAIESVARPKNPRSFFYGAQNAYLDRPCGNQVEGVPPINPYLSKGVFWAPIVTWASINATAKSQTELWNLWHAVKPRLLSELRFIATLVSDAPEKTLSDGTGLTAIYLEDDKGRRFEPVSRQSKANTWRPVIGFTDGEESSTILGWEASNTLTFSFVDEAGSPIINADTSFVKLVIEGAEGKAWFLFPFDDGGGYYSGRAAVEPPIATVSDDGFEFTNVVARETSGFTRVMGESRNLSGRDYQLANFTLTLYHASGSIAGVGHFTVSNFRNGSTKTFDVLVDCPLPDGYRWKIQFENGY
ncbi:MAG: hypothetical protein QME79_11320 [Bacillota bacterium]|nr:hypothetical protein [Bacillota bacterium]